MPLHDSFFEKSTLVGIAYDEQALAHLATVAFGTGQIDDLACTHAEEMVSGPITCKVFYADGSMADATRQETPLTPQDIARQLVNRFGNDFTWRFGIPYLRPKDYREAWEIRTVLVSRVPAVIARAIYAPK